MISVSHLVSQKYREYKKALTVNAVDLTDEAKTYFDTSLKARVGLNQEVTEMKFKVEKIELCAESDAESSPPPAESFAPSQPPPPPLALPDPNAGPTGRAVGKGLVVFSESDDPAPAAVTAGSAAETTGPSSKSAGKTGDPPKPKVPPKVPHALPLSCCSSTHPLFPLLACAQKRRRKEENKENQPASIAPIETGETGDPPKPKVPHALLAARLTALLSL